MMHRFMIVAQYFAKLNSLWQELYFYQYFQAYCPNDVAKFQKLVDNEQVYDFLACLNMLNMEYAQIRI